MNSAIKKDCFSLIQEIALKERPYCLVPGCCKPSTAGHHIFTRSRLSTAFNPQAVIALCESHHAFAHSHPAEGRKMAAGIIGPDYEALRQISLMVVRFRDSDFVRIRTILKSRLEGL